MSSDEDELDLNEASTPQLNTQPEDDGMDTEDATSVRNSPAPAPRSSEPPQRLIDYTLNRNFATCKTYDCVPLVAAIHPAPIYSVAATRCFRWVFTGSDDGYVRKWDFFSSMNGKTALTQAQRHQHVDSVTMAGVLSSWFENEEQPVVVKSEPTVTNEQASSSTTTTTTTTTTPAAATDNSNPIIANSSVNSTIVASTAAPSSSSTTTNLNHPQQPPKLSPVYSMDVHSEGLWALLGTESGNINLVTVRHDEGKCHHVLRSHTAPVSVLRVTPGETGVISGSWDKSVLEWDLNTGSVVRTYAGHSSQISSASFQPVFDPSKDEDQEWDQKNPNIFMTTSFDGQCFIWDRREPEKDATKLGLSDRTPPWCLSACWSADGSKIYMGRRNGQVDEWDFASQKLIRSFRMPANSGPVSYVASMPNNKHIICASNDNVRLWNTEIESIFTLYPEADKTPKPSSYVIPFTILPGHHGGTISHIDIDPTCRYMITTSGNRGWDGISTNACLFYDITPIV
ncbi:WD40-repeat-containing domain protein [Zychaea mexicana]|uniref:WD40-repeat-containing domain protein n=1 Tax=Zychaea mexicana TaxID=64656 RepID=UPI0022FEE0DF|nr:WD40-repeat-containing domain protein [Zychaea mexicana]KAI9488410.1 WD40-repeat-containing domain protein [Zychaea mexicana]